MNALSRLILNRKTELDLTWDEIRDRGGFSSHTVAYHLAKRPTHKASPKPSTIERLAKALDLPILRMWAAAQEAVGGTPEEIRPLLDALSHLDSRRLATLTEVARDLRMDGDTP